MLDNCALLRDMQHHFAFTIAQGRTGVKSNPLTTVAWEYLHEDPVFKCAICNFKVVFNFRNATKPSILM